MVPTTRLRGRYSYRWQQVSAQSRVTWSPVLRPEPITKQLLHFVLSLLVQVIRLRYTSTDLIYRGSSSLLCGGKFHFCCGTTVSSIGVCVWRNTTAFSCYGFHFIYICICMPWRVACNWERQRSMGVCFIALLYFSFCCGSYISCICVECNTLFCYACHFISKYCVFHMYITIAAFSGRQLLTVWRPRVHDAARGRKRETFQIFNESSAVCS